MNGYQVMTFFAAGPLAFVCAVAAPAANTWKQLPSIPDVHGFAGAYAGVAGGALLVAGGANFPDRPPWEGGTKTWYDHVFVLERNVEAWREVGRMPKPGGYGVAITTGEELLLVGGGDAHANFEDVWLVRRKKDGGVVFEPRPRLPRPLAMAAGACVGRTIYIAGGIDSPAATHAQHGVLALDLDSPTANWREIPPCPGPERILATAGALKDGFYLFGGAQLVPDGTGKIRREWLRDAWCYTAAGGWKRLANLPRAAVAAPGPAPTCGGRLLVVGGDDGAQVNAAPLTHTGFPRSVLGYDPVADNWTVVGEVPFSLVTTTAVVWAGQLVIPGGEARPGVRSTAVWAAPLEQPK